MQPGKTGGNLVKLQPEISRRAWHRRAIGSLLTVSLLESLHQAQLLGKEFRPVAAGWLKELNQLGQDVKDQKLRQVAWQQKVEELYSQVDVPDLLRSIDFDKLTARIDWPERGARSLRFSFPQQAGVPGNLVFGRQIFALQKDRSVVPHGHNNMATAFLVLQGNLRGRHFDRVQDEPGHMLIRPTIDREFTTGGTSTVSDLKDNVHWFQATSQTAFIFNIHVLGVNPQATNSTGRVYVDPQGEKLADGLIRAPLVDYKTVNERYG